ncbi:lipoprotein-releasing system permease protein [Leeuwenhoekiella aestuarii]|uniref:Lipoprotein-releasing system permease protein n=1 Tax=Leeuwenhoekiella aestuarii TaxID=2249426 RepID=A0A4Q0NZF9_9FLAO|nr:FtsX-like permease family protein [Leeuwenhoekiella aestuarii]RXG17965.1 lipoprotein-releasing system permease protein [Leeuwenhoekiella aestuarii]RXG19294.1 lipoprotein-releasing system permease protein [Leeuwenhoekiella aestuarii]
MKFSVFIAKRYLFTKSSNNAINIITLISAISIIAGSAALFIVLSGFSGLKDFSLSFSSIFDPDLKVIPASGKTISFSKKQAEDLKNIEGVAYYTQIIEERAFLEFRGKNHIAYVKGVDENYMRVNNIDSTLLYGNWITPEEPVAAIGFGISRILSLGVNNYTDLLRVMVPKPGTGQFTDPSQAFNSSQLVVSDIFQVNEEIDQKYIFTNLEYVRQLLRYNDSTLSALELKIKPSADPLAVKDSVQKLFGDQVEVKTRFQLNDKLYKMLNAENLAVYMIFTLVLIIALFNLVGSIIMIIIDKKANIKTLHSLGASLKEIKKIYFLQGAMMTVFGGLIGIFLGALIVGAQLQFQLKMITPTLPYPMEFTLVNFLAVFFTISILGILASYLASSTIRPKLLVD